MKKHILCMLFAILIVCASSTNTYSQDDSISFAWKNSLAIDFTTTQTAYSDTWVGGEAGSVNWVSNLNASFEKNWGRTFNSRTTIKISFGQTLTQDSETKDWSKPRKSTDLIDIEEVGSFRLNKFVDPFLALRVETQFVNASVEAKKRHLSPMKFTESFGVSKRFYEKDKELIFSRLGFAIRQIKEKVILDNVTLETVDSTLTDGGLESVTDFKLNLSENLHYTGKLSLYKAFFFSGEDEVKGTLFETNWKAIDVNWENTIAAKVSKIVTVNLYFQLLYDKEVIDKGRIKETVGLGFVFNML